VETGRRAPEGTVALLFTDIEGSTRLVTELGAGWAAVLADHHELVGSAIAAEGGFVDGIEGDAFFATFDDAVAAGRAAVAAQRALRAHRWPETVGELRVRMGLHVGRVERTDTGYVGLEVHRAARVGAAAHGGQLLLTAAARELAGDELVAESAGVHRLKDFPAPVMLFCAVIDGRGADAFPPPRTESVRPTNLAAARGQLIGRDRELDELLEAVCTEGERLVTITGRGGAGKTSLALLAGARMLDRHPGGVWWVDLTAVDGPEGVLPAIAAVVGAEGESDDSVQEALEVRLRNGGPTLVLVDNMEHVLAAAAELCGLLDELPELRMVATSRLPLRAGPERVIQLDALEEDAAVELIGRSVRRVGALARVTDRDRDALREIVQLLDGLPLALELAAARLSLLSAVQLRDRLRASIDVLGEDRGDRPVRQRSLRAVLDSTLSLLDPSGRELFVRLSVFAGPVELEEIETVLSGGGVDVLGALADLLAAALVQRVETGDGVIRFGLPEALRQLASELLERDPGQQRLRRAHARRQCELVWAARAGPDRKTLLAALASERELEAAWRWASAKYDPLEQPVANAYAWVLLRKGRVREAGAITERQVASLPADPRGRWYALNNRAGCLAYTGRLDEARGFAGDAAHVAPDPSSRCGSLIMRGICNVFGGHVADGVKDHIEATILARAQADEPALLAYTLGYEAQALIVARRLDEAAARLDEARTVGSPVDANALRDLDSLLGDLALADGRPADALEPKARSLETAFADGDSGQAGIDLINMVEVLAALGEDEETLEVMGTAESLMAEIGSNPTHVLSRLTFLTDIEHRIGSARAAELKELGRAVPAAERVTRVCRLARSHAPAHATAGP
jgi:predicted ATPase/class 3 adenylate cyclase